MAGVGVRYSEEGHLIEERGGRGTNGEGLSKTAIGMMAGGKKDRQRGAARGSERVKRTYEEEMRRGGGQKDGGGLGGGGGDIESGPPKLR